WFRRRASATWDWFRSREILDPPARSECHLSTAGSPTVGFARGWLGLVADAVGRLRSNVGGLWQARRCPRPPACSHSRRPERDRPHNPLRGRLQPEGPRTWPRLPQVPRARVPTAARIRLTRHRELGDLIG